MTWKVSLAKAQPLRAAFVLFCVFVVWITGSIIVTPLVGLIAALVLGSALSDFLFAVQYTITPEYVEYKSLTGCKKMMWSEIACCAYSNQSLLFSTVKPTSPFYPFRGLTVHLPKENSAQVLEIVNSCRGKEQ